MLIVSDQLVLFVHEDRVIRAPSDFMFTIAHKILKHPVCRICTL
jgi:hypothetical protein